MDVNDQARIGQAWVTMSLPETTDAAARELARDTYAQGWRDGVREMRRYLIEWARYYAVRGDLNGSLLAEACERLAINTEQRPPAPVTKRSGAERS